MRPAIRFTASCTPFWPSIGREVSVLNIKMRSTLPCRIIWPNLKEKEAPTFLAAVTTHLEAWDPELAKMELPRGKEYWNFSGHSAMKVVDSLASRGILADMSKRVLYPLARNTSSEVSYNGYKFTVALRERLPVQSSGNSSPSRGSEFVISRWGTSHSMLTPPARAESTS